MQKENEKHLELQFIHQETAFKKAIDYHVDIISKKDRIISNLKQCVSHKTKMMKEAIDNYKTTKSELMAKSVELCNTNDILKNLKAESTKNLEELELVQNTIIAEYKTKIDNADRKIAELETKLNNQTVFDRKSNELEEILKSKMKEIDEMKAINVGLCEDFEAKEATYKKQTKLLKRKVKQLRLALHNYADEEFEEDAEEADGTPSEASDMEDIEMKDVEELLEEDSAVSDTDSDFDPAQ